MQISLRCPEGHVSHWILNTLPDHFQIFCSACGHAYVAHLLSDGSWIVTEDVTHKPWDGKEPPKEAWGKGGERGG